MIVEQIHHVPPQPSAVGRARYLIIGAVAVLAIAVGVVLGSVLVGGGAGAALSGAAGYAPTDAVVYAEVRLDLPGAQRANLRAILDRFPGADADAVLTDALADTLDQALADGQAPFDYSNDVAPWFDGTVAMVLLDYPLNADPANLRLPSVVGLFGVRDVAGATALADTLRGELEAGGATFTSSEHGGVTIWSMDVDEAQLMPMQNAGFAYALTDDQLLLGNGTESVTAALDARGGDSIADSGEVGQLLDDLPEERTAVMVTNTAAMIEQLRGELEAAQPGLAEALAGYLDAVPPISVASLSFAADAVLLDASSGLPEGPLRPENGNRALADRVPADAILFADGAGTGPALEQVITTLKATIALTPDGASALAELENVESAVGAELEEFVSWIGDGALAAGWDGQNPWFGLVLEATDADAAARRLNQIGALAELAAGQGQVGVEVSTETVAGVEVTTVSFAGGMPGSGMESLALQYALDGDTALIGIAGFVETALTIVPGDSLAGAERFNAALDRFGGSDNAGSFYLDLAALRAAIESTFPVGVDVYPQEVRDNLAPLDYLAGVTRVDGDRVVSHIGVVLR